MQRDADDRTDLGLAPDVEEADGIEQLLPLRPDLDGSGAGLTVLDPLPGDANPDDVVEQRLEVPFEDEDYPPG